MKTTSQAVVRIERDNIGKGPGTGQELNKIYLPDQGLNSVLETEIQTHTHTDTRTTLPVVNSSACVGTDLTFEFPKGTSSYSPQGLCTCSSLYLACCPLLTSMGLLYVFLRLSLNVTSSRESS